MDDEDFIPTIKSFNEPDAWNTGRYIVYACNRRNRYRYRQSFITEAVYQTDNLINALVYINANSDRTHHYKLYDRILVSFDIEDILRTALMEDGSR